ncbi:DUF5694 domain-containing protein [Luteimonas salinisoli]|uniref:DUF5694 domain-containing protein n=1 Tax=Luteimonas salinisoli TaxID=2752307 RepID=UPI0031F319C8
MDAHGALGILSKRRHRIGGRVMGRNLAVAAGLPLALAMALTMPFAPATAQDATGRGHRPGQAVEEGLRAYVSPRVQSEIMVFGTWHLSAFREWLEPRHLDGTLALLERFAPTRIAIERIPPDEIAMLTEHAANDPVADRVLGMFARSILPPARAMQQALDVDRSAAARRADALLGKASQGLEPAERVDLVAHLLAAYEYDSAALQWSYLSPTERDAAEALPVEVRESLDRRLEGTDEIALVAMPLARELGLQRLYPVDSQYEGMRTLAFPAELVDEVFGRASEETTAAGTIPRLLAKADRAREEDADLLGIGLEVNTHETQMEDTAQWAPWLAMDHPSGLDRFRYAMWELRNHRMAAHLLNVAASTKPERVLFLVGFSHKSYVDRALEPHLGIRLVQPGSLDR